MRILKYELEITDRQTISFGDSEGSPLSVAEQDGKLMMWCMVKEDKLLDGFSHILKVEIVGTGHLSRKLYKGNFVGTVVMRNGFVWHVFARDGRL